MSNFIKRQPSIDSDQSDDSKSEADTISLSDINFNTSSDWNYIINPNPLGANYWRNNKTGQQQNEPPLNMRQKEINKIMYSMDIDEDSNDESPLLYEETKVNVNKTQENRYGCKNEVDCMVRSIKGLGWINDEDRDELVENWVHKKAGITTTKINNFLEQKKYDYKLIEEYVLNIHINEWVLEMENDTCMLIMLPVDPKAKQKNQEIIDEKLILLEIDNDMDNISKKEYDIKKKEILNMKIEYGYHVVIFCKEDDVITLWDTQQVLFNGTKYVENVGKDAINEYLNHTGLSGNNFKIIKKEIDIIEKMKKLSMKKLSIKNLRKAKSIKKTKRIKKAKSIKKAKGIKKLKLKKTNKKPNYSKNIDYSKYKKDRRNKVTKKQKENRENILRSKRMKK